MVNNNTNFITEYIKDVKRTIPNDLSKNELITSICLGLGGEAGEILDYLKKTMYHKHPFNDNHLKEEIGDLCWYLFALINSYDFNFVDILKINIEKRLKRYPNGFNYKDSIDRRDKVD